MIAIGDLTLICFERKQKRAIVSSVLDGIGISIYNEENFLPNLGGSSFQYNTMRVLTIVS